MTNGEGPAGGRELPELARSCEIDGIQVTVRTFLVAEPRPRYEVVLSSASQTAIVDIPADEGDALDERIDQALSGFVAAIRARIEFNGS
jgi:hypothetical protein